MKLPDTLFGEKMRYWPTKSVEECREHADNFVIIFANIEEYKRITGRKMLEYRDPAPPIAAWYEDGVFSGRGHFENFEKEYDYEADFKPFTFFVYSPKAQII